MRTWGGAGRWEALRSEAQLFIPVEDRWPLLRVLLAIGLAFMAGMGLALVVKGVW